MTAPYFDTSYRALGKESPLATFEVLKVQESRGALRNTVELTNHQLNALRQR